MDTGLLLILALGLVLSACVWAYKALTSPRRGPWTDQQKGRRS